MGNVLNGVLLGVAVVGLFIRYPCYRTVSVKRVETPRREHIKSHSTGALGLSWRTLKLCKRQIVRCTGTLEVRPAVLSA